MTAPQNGVPAVVPPVPWAQQAAVPRERSTSRSRQMVRGLPSWDPLPPGEMLVQRHRRD
jgi:hypothetical protein